MAANDDVMPDSPKLSIDELMNELAALANNVLSPTQSTTSLERPATPIPSTWTSLHQYRQLATSPTSFSALNGRTRNTRHDRVTRTAKSGRSEISHTLLLRDSTAFPIKTTKVNENTPQTACSSHSVHSTHSSPSLSSSIDTASTTSFESIRSINNEDISDWSFSEITETLEPLRTKRHFSSIRKAKRLPHRENPVWQVHAVIQVNENLSVSQTIGTERSRPERSRPVAQSSGSDPRSRAIDTEPEGLVRQRSGEGKRQRSGFETLARQESGGLSDTFWHIPRKSSQESAFVHYRGASFEVINPHASLVQGHSIVETPGVELDGLLDDYLAFDSSMEENNRSKSSTPSSSETMAPSRQLYSDPMSARRNILGIRQSRDIAQLQHAQQHEEEEQLQQAQEDLQENAQEDAQEDARYQAQHIEDYSRHQHRRIQEEESNVQARVEPSDTVDGIIGSYARPDTARDSLLITSEQSRVDLRDYLTPSNSTTSTISNQWYLQEDDPSLPSPNPSSSASNNATAGQRRTEHRTHGTQTGQPVQRPPALHISRAMQNAPPLPQIPSLPHVSAFREHFESPGTDQPTTDRTYGDTNQLLQLRNITRPAHTHGFYNDMQPSSPPAHNIGRQIGQASSSLTQNRGINIQNLQPAPQLAQHGTIRSQNTQARSNATHNVENTQARSHTIRNTNRNVEHLQARSQAPYNIENIQARSQAAYNTENVQATSQAEPEVEYLQARTYIPPLRFAQTSSQPVSPSLGEVGYTQFLRERDEIYSSLGEDANFIQDGNQHFNTPASPNDRRPFTIIGRNDSPGDNQTILFSPSGEVDTSFDSTAYEQSEEIDAEADWVTTHTLESSDGLSFNEMPYNSGYEFVHNRFRNISNTYGTINPFGSQDGHVSTNQEATNINHRINAPRNRATEPVLRDLATIYHNKATRMSHMGQPTEEDDRRVQETQLAEQAINELRQRDPQLFNAASHEFNRRFGRQTINELNRVWSYNNLRAPQSANPTRPDSFTQVIQAEQAHHRLLSSRSRVSAHNLFSSRAGLRYSPTQDTFATAHDAGSSTRLLAATLPVVPAAVVVASSQRGQRRAMASMSGQTGLRDLQLTSTPTSNIRGIHESPLRRQRNGLFSRFSAPRHGVESIELQDLDVPGGAVDGVAGRRGWGERRWTGGRLSPHLVVGRDHQDDWTGASQDIFEENWWNPIALLRIWCGSYDAEVARRTMGELVAVDRRTKAEALRWCTVMVLAIICILVVLALCVVLAIIANRP